MRKTALLSALLAFLALSGAVAQAGGETGPGAGRLAFTFNPLAPIAGAFVLGGLDLTVDLQWTFSPLLVASIEPELALGSTSGFALDGGLLLYPLATAPKGFFVSARGGLADFDGKVSPLIGLGLGYQISTGHFVFSPELGFRYAYQFGLLLKPSLGWVF